MRIFFVTFILIVFTLKANCQQEIEKIYDYSASFYAKDIVKVDDGGYFIVGYDPTTWLTAMLKVDQQGNKIWDKFISQCNIYSAVKCPGGFYLAGKKHLYLGYYQGILIKINSNGDTLWTKRYNYNSSNSSLYKVKKLDSGDLLLIHNYGYFLELFKLIKTDSLGNIIWKTGVGGNTDLIQINENEVALTGFDYIDQPEPEFDDLMWPTLEIYDFTNGENKFYYPFQYMNWAQGKDLVYDGYYFYMLTDNQDYAISKLYYSDTIWTRKYPDDLILNSICITDENFLLTTGSYSDNLMVFTLSPEGDSVSMYLKNEFQAQYGLKMIIDNDSLVLIGNAGTNNPISFDMYFLKMPLDYLLTGINQMNINKKDGVNIYPNPFHNQINIHFPEKVNDQVYIQIFNIQGIIENKFTVKAPETTISLNSSQLKPGLYFISVTSKEKYFCNKLIIKN